MQEEGKPKPKQKLSTAAAHLHLPPSPITRDRHRDRSSINETVPPLPPPRNDLTFADSESDSLPPSTSFTNTTELTLTLFHSIRLQFVCNSFAIRLQFVCNSFAIRLQFVWLARFTRCRRRTSLSRPWTRLGTEGLWGAIFSRYR